MSTDIHLRNTKEKYQETQLYIDKLERENKDLRRSVFELSIRLDSIKANQNASTSTYSLEPLDLSSLLLSDSCRKNSPLDTDLKSLHVSASSGNLGNISQATGKSTSLNNDSRRKPLQQAFQIKSDLRAHQGAVYAVKFSSCGRFLATGSMDKKVMLWDVLNRKNHQPLKIFDDHTQLVIDVSWSRDSSLLLSAAYDHSVRLWDVGQMQLRESRFVKGLCQTASFSPLNDRIILVGTSQKQIHHIDTRSNCTSVWKHNAMINSLYVCKDGYSLISGDGKGMIKTWDMRIGRPIPEADCLNDPDGHPISHLHASWNGNSVDDKEEFGRYLAVNSYDNILRVYDRESNLLQPNYKHHQLQLIHVATGHKNKNWPIKSSFFHSDGSSNRFSSSYLMDQKGDVDQNSVITTTEENQEEILFLATGSADNNIYVYDVTKAKEQSSLFQKLVGHQDKVYSVDFHPTELILASASADFTIKLWTARNTSRVL